MRLTGEDLIFKVEAALQGADIAENLLALLEEVQPFDLAEALSQMDEEQARQVLSALEPAMAAEVLEHWEYIDQYRMLHHMEQLAAQRILDQMSSDAVVDLFKAIHPRQAQTLLNLLPAEYAAIIRGLMEYPENTAGARMTIDYISVRDHMTTEQVIDHIRKVGSEAETVSYIYVVDSAGRLTGVVSLRELVMAGRRQRISDFMNEKVVAVSAAMDQEEMARIVSQYDLVAVPVISEDNRLLGIVTVDNVIDVIHEEASEDVYRLAATPTPPDELDATSFLQSVWLLARPRLPWLVSLLFLEMGSSFIVQTLSDVVTPAVAVTLALFTVVMAGESGNAATQSLAVVVRGLATGEIREKDMPRVVMRETLVGVLVGLVVGSALMITGWIWQGHWLFGFAIGLALAVNLFVAKMLGGLFPVVIHRMGIDPAVASGPLITTLTDNMSMLVYYGIAAMILRHVA